jgi:flagellar export protein FliJ
MPKKKYPYQVVLDVRAEKKREAGRVVASCREQLEEAEAELARRVRAVEESRRLHADAQQVLDELSTGPAKVRHVVEHREYVAELKHKERESEARVAEQRVEVARAAGALERAMSALVEAAREEQAAENHLADWRREQRREEERAEQKRFDEIGTAFYGRRRV